MRRYGSVVLIAKGLERSPGLIKEYWMTFDRLVPYELVEDMDGKSFASGEKGGIGGVADVHATW